MKIPVIDNGSQWTHRIKRTLRDLGCETEIIPNTTPLSSLKDADGLVFSGGALRIGKGEESTAGNCGEYVDKFHGPIIGICAGQQYLALYFGGKVAPAKVPEYGEVGLIIDERDDLFEGLPPSFTVWASHNDEVVEAPGFGVLAHSKDCGNHAMKHEKRPIYGTLFHPEVEHTQHGEEIYANFLKVCKK
jgi:GMP synthase (glutamine-hydrolysing)